MNQKKDEQKKNISTPKQLSIRSFFSSNASREPILKQNSPVSSPKRMAFDEKPSSPDLIEATPDQQTKKKITLFRKNNASSKKQLIFSSHSEKRKREPENESSKSIDSDNLLDDLLKEMESSEIQPKKQSLLENKNSNSFLNLSKNPLTKRVKLSSSVSSHSPPIHIKPLKLSDKNIESLDKINIFNRIDTPKKMISVPDIENLGDLLNDDWEDFNPTNRELQLSKWTYCRVKTVEYLKTGVLIKLEEYSKLDVSSSTALCLLKGCWCDTPVKAEDIVSVKAHYDSKTAYWLVDNEEGFIVIYPDILITGTGVVESLFCCRRSVLSSIFPGSDPPNMSMVIGSLVHELLQEILKKKLFTKQSMKTVISELMNCRRTIFLAYECDVPLTTINSELEEFLPKISSFINTYFITNNCEEQKTWAGEILEITSIEENFWIPNLGIKGKTDMVVKARIENKIKILPLELKTGRASNSAEHRGQIILYSMMMTETGMDVNSGLLLYLRENKMNEIKPKHPERSGLISMRNNLVNFTVANETLKFIDNKFQLPILPEPINHHNACAKCPYLTMCSSAMSKKHREGLSKDNPLVNLSSKSLEHLSESHINYVFHWFGLLKLEEMTRKTNRLFNISDVWHKDVNIREARGFCISKLRIQSVEISGSRFLHKMTRVSNDFLDLTTSGLTEGDYIIISRGSRYALATGYVHSIFSSEISFRLDRLLDNNSELFVVDKYSMYDSLLGFNTSSLLLLFENSVLVNNLRSYIIDVKMPEFSRTVNLKYDESILRNLNESQKSAVLKTLQMENYMLIKGMPGTGKTATIVALVKLLVSLKFTVLITSHTHSAVDNILLRLKNEVDFLRIGSHVRVHPALKNYCEEFLLQSYSLESVQDLENFYEEKQVIAVTCMGCSHALFRKRVFDYCIVDEATQVLQPSIIRPLYSSKKFILIGDPEQLPPVVQSKEASCLGLSESLFKRLDRLDVTSTLYLQYRMNSEIMKLANLFTYENALHCANESVRSATIDLKIKDETCQENWLKLVVSDKLCNSVVLLNTSNVNNDSISDYSNPTEVNITFTILETLNRVCNDNHDIGIIAPFREQVELLRKSAASKKYKVEINTVDQYQGRDKDIIIYSCTKSSSTGDNGILSDKRRLTVAITRAKRKLIIIGNIEVLKTYSVFKDLFDFIPNLVNIDNC